MSTPWSGVLRNDFTWVGKRSPHIHSHWRQSLDAGLPERSGTESYVKVVVRPDNGDYTSDPMTWPVIIDEHRRPRWVEDEWPRVEDSARLQASAWARAHIVRDDGGTICVRSDETIIVVGSPARIDVAAGGRCFVCDSSSPGRIDVADEGLCYVGGSSAPGHIDVAAGGSCCVYDSSAPGRIDVADGGWCETSGTSAPARISVADGGWCGVYDSSAPGRIDVAAGGFVYWRSSVPSEGRIVYAAQKGRC